MLSTCICGERLTQAVLTVPFILAHLVTMVCSEDTFRYLSGAGVQNNSSLELPKISFTPGSVEDLLVDSSQMVRWNYSNILPAPNDGRTWRYLVTYEPENAQIAVPKPAWPMGNSSLSIEHMARNRMQTNLQRVNTFSVHGVYLGRASIKVLVWREEVVKAIPTIHTPLNASGNATLTGSELNATQASPLVEELLSATYSVSVIRHVRLVDDVFRWVVAVVGVLTNFAVGCASDKSAILQQFKRPGGLVITTACKVLLLPPLSMGIAAAFGLSGDLSLGLLFTACIPSGGLGFFLTAAFRGNTELAMAAHLANTVLALGSFALWTFTLGLYTPTVAALLWTLEWITAWLTCNLVAYLLGVALHLCVPSAASQLLDWLIKPVLLLFVLVYITIGNYINSYAFVILDTMSTVAVALLPCSAFALATLLGYVFCQERKCRKAIACEMSTFNGVLLLGMIHFTLPRLEADLTAMVPCLAMLITPVPFVLWLLGHKLKMLFSDKYNNNNLDSMKNMERSRKNSVASSLINDTTHTNLSSSQSPQTGSPIEEQVVEPGEADVFVDQVTVL